MNELLLSSVIVLVAFLLIEYRSKGPLMPLGLLRRGSIFGGPIGLAVLLTVANFETSVGTGQLAVHSASAMVLGFGYAFLVAALLTVIGTLLKQQRHSQAGVVGTAVTVHQS